MRLAGLFVVNGADGFTFRPCVLWAEETADDEQGDPAEVKFAEIEGRDEVEESEPWAEANVAKPAGGDHEG